MGSLPELEAESAATPSSTLPGRAGTWRPLSAPNATMPSSGSPPATIAQITRDRRGSTLRLAALLGLVPTTAPAVTHGLLAKSRLISTDCVHRSTRAAIALQSAVEKVRAFNDALPNCRGLF
jgi:hypothetical protein